MDEAERLRGEIVEDSTISPRAPGRNRTEGTKSVERVVHVEAHYGLERSGFLPRTPITPTLLTPAMLPASAAWEGVSLRLFADVSGDESGPCCQPRLTRPSARG